LLARPDEDDATLSRLPGALQERIRQRLWGEDRERAREALERAELGVSAEREGASPTADRLAQASHPIDASDPEERWAIAPAPPPAPDARPDLAAAQRRDAPVLKMSVPPSYEAVVRAAFAHQGKEPRP